jgi:hypothetical protein
MTHDGQIVVSGNSTSHHQEETIMPDTSDLSSLAAAAETHEGMVRSKSIKMLEKVKSNIRESLLDLNDLTVIPL